MSLDSIRSANNGIAEQAPIYDTESFERDDHSITDDNGSAAQAPLYATLFPAATAWHKATAFFGDLTESLSLAITLLSGAATARQPLFDREKLNEPWTPDNLTKHLLALQEPVEKALMGIYDVRIKGNPKAVGAALMKLVELRDLLVPTRGWDRMAALQGKIDSLKGAIDGIPRSGESTKIIDELKVISCVMRIRLQPARLAVLDAYGSTELLRMESVVPNIQEAAQELISAYEWMSISTQGQTGFPAYYDPWEDPWLLTRTGDAIKDLSPALRETVMLRLNAIYYHSVQYLPLLWAAYPDRGADTMVYWQVLLQSRIRGEKDIDAIASVLADVDEVEADLRRHSRQGAADQWRATINAMIVKRASFTDLSGPQTVSRSLARAYAQQYAAQERPEPAMFETVLMHHERVDLGAMPVEERFWYQRDVAMARVARALWHEDCPRIREAIAALEPLFQEAESRGDAAIASALTLQIAQLKGRYIQVKSRLLAQVDAEDAEHPERRLSLLRSANLLYRADEPDRAEKLQLKYNRHYQNDTPEKMVVNIRAFIDGEEPRIAAEILAQDVLRLGEGPYPDVKAFVDIQTVYDHLRGRLSFEEILDLFVHIDPTQRRAAFLVMARCEEAVGRDDHALRTYLAAKALPGSDVDETRWIDSEIQALEGYLKAAVIQEAREQTSRWLATLPAEVALSEAEEASRPNYLSPEIRALLRHPMPFADLMDAVAGLISERETTKDRNIFDALRECKRMYPNLSALSLAELIQLLVPAELEGDFLHQCEGWKGNPNRIAFELIHYAHYQRSSDARRDPRDPGLWRTRVLNEMYRSQYKRANVEAARAREWREARGREEFGPKARERALQGRAH